MEMKTKTFLTLLLWTTSYVALSQQKADKTHYPKIEALSDRILFTYKSEAKPTMDTYQVDPIEFYIYLPKDLKFYDIESSSDFGFYFSKNQVIFIKTRFYNADKSRDSVYVPSFQEVEKLIDREFLTDENEKYNIKKIPFDRRRKNFLIRKTGVTILVFNVLNKNKSKYVEFAKSLSRTN